MGRPEVTRLAEAHTRIRRLTGRLDGVRYTLLSRIEDDGSWRSGGTRTFTTWLRVREGVSARTAGKDMTMARRLATALPVTRERLVAGTLGVDHARVMTEVAPTSETRTDALAWLIDTRTGHTTTPEQFVQTVPVDFPDPADDPDGTRTRELVTQVLEGAITDGTLTTGEGMVLREAGVVERGPVPEGRPPVRDRHRPGHRRRRRRQGRAGRVPRPGQDVRRVPRGRVPHR